MSTVKIHKDRNDLKQFLIDMLPVIVTGIAVIILEILNKLFGG